MTSATERQVGGSHYNGTDRKVQHWDLMVMARAGYFPGQITKYTERHPKKNGKQDLEKALHFAEKFHEAQQPAVKVPLRKRGLFGRSRVVEVPLRLPVNPALIEAIRDYAIDAGLTALQERIFELCLLRPDRTEEIVELCKKHLDREYGAKRSQSVEVKLASSAYSREDIQKILDGVSNEIKDGHVSGELLRPGTPEDGGHHEGQFDTPIPPLEEPVITSPGTEDELVRGINEEIQAEIERQRSPKPRGKKTPEEVTPEEQK